MGFVPSLTHPTVYVSDIVFVRGIIPRVMGTKIANS